MQSNDSEIVRSNEAHKNDVREERKILEPVISALKTLRNRVELEQCVEMLLIHILNR